MAAYRPMIERIFDEEGVPLELIHLAQAESGFKPNARSHARAVGMWQFVAYRGRQYGLRQDRYIDERQDPEKATRAAARHLRDLYIEFGDWYLAMAGYNSGPMRVKRAIQRGRTEDYWEMSRRQLLPRETRKYVPIILAMVYLGKNPELVRLDGWEAGSPLSYATVETDSEIALELIADLTNTAVSELRDLNPALLRSATPPYRYELRLPEGRGEAFEREIALIPHDKRLLWRRHEVREGETLASIAKRYQVSEQEIASLNELDGLAAGARLTIPAKSTKLVSYRSQGGAGGLLEPGSGRYRVARGDTLGAIAGRFGVSIADLKQWNGLQGHRIVAGRYLIVGPKADGGSIRAAGSSPSGKYTVRRGDNLNAIASRFGVSVSQLKAWNALPTDQIVAGNILRVPGSQGSAASGSPAVAPASGRYRIQRGDNLAAIAARFGVTVSDLKAWNGLKTNQIRAGSHLTVRPHVEPASLRRETNAALSVAPPANGSYRIRRGDSLAAVSERFGVTVADLKTWNNLRSSRITAGDSLVVRPPHGSAAAPQAVSQAATKPQRYQVRTGDNLASIANRFGLTVEQLKDWNGLRSSRIQAGSYLTLHAGGSPTRAAASDARDQQAEQAEQYRIRSGDTLEKIAQRFSVTVDQLKTWNRLRNTRIRAGQYLLVRPSGSQDPNTRAAVGG
jgi:membrane-bound lytic murein transglycosylase D